MAGYEIAAATMSAETSFMFFASMFTAMAAATMMRYTTAPTVAASTPFASAWGPPRPNSTSPMIRLAADDYHARTQRIVSKFLILGDERT